jgi:hypothetical protein
MKSYAQDEGYGGCSFVIGRDEEGSMTSIGKLFPISTYQLDILSKVLLVT